MIEGNISKQPAEKFPISLDFTKYLEAGETITSGAGTTVTSKNKETGSSTTATLLSGTYAISGSKVIQTIHQGTDGEDHLVEFRITTSASKVYEGEICVLIRNV